MSALDVCPCIPISGDHGVMVVYEQRHDHGWCEVDENG